MIVKELKKILDTMPDDLEIVMSKDGEGNSFSPLSDCSTPDEVRYIPETTYSGEIIGTDELEEEGYKIEDTIPALVLWPTN